MAGVVAAVAQGDLLVERIAGQQHLEITFVESGIDLDDLHRDRVTRVSEGLAIFKHQSHVARALARRGQGIAVHRRIAVADVRQGRLVDHAVILGGVDHIAAGHRRTLTEGFQLRAQRVDRGIPLALVVSVAVWAEAL